MLWIRGNRGSVKHMKTDSGAIFCSRPLIGKTNIVEILCVPPTEKPIFLRPPKLSQLGRAFVIPPPTDSSQVIPTAKMIFQKPQRSGLFKRKCKWSIFQKVSHFGSYGILFFIFYFLLKIYLQGEFAQLSVGCYSFHLEYSTMHTRTAVTSHRITFCLWRGEQISSQLFLRTRFKLTCVFWCILL